MVVCNKNSTKLTQFFLVIIFCVVMLIIQWHLLQHKEETHNTEDKFISFMDYMDVDVMNVSQINQVIQSFTLTSIASRLKKVEIHAKSMKTLRLIRTVNDDMNKLFSKLELDYSKVETRYLKPKPKTVCPEKYEGYQYGFSEKGFTVTQCSYGKSLSALVTLVTISLNGNKDLSQFSEKCNIYFPKVSVLIGTNYSLNILHVPSSVTIQDNMTGTPGEIWNSLIMRVSTPYILVARDVTDLDEHVNLQRLIREKELFNIAAVGGSLRDIHSFHWKIGCYQREFPNYTLVYQEGYDEAQHGCLVCDHIDGPFLVETKKLKSIKFDCNLDVGLFEDFFLRLGLEQALVCPDVMFHVSAAQRQTEKFLWEKMASKHEIHKLKFIPGFEIIFSM